MMQRTAGLAVLVLVTLVYLLSLRASAWPPGHPWSGITLLCLAVVQLVGPKVAAGRFQQAPPVLGLAAVSLTVAGAAFWAAAAFLA